MSVRYLILRLIYFLRDVSSRQMFKKCGIHVRGDVLDVGGGEFFFSKVQKHCQFDSWTVVDPVEPNKPFVAPRYKFIKADGMALPFSNDQYDTVLNIQVLEHTWDPRKVFSEIVRVLKPGGKGIFLIPQTANLHMAPHHYYNFTQYWIRKVVDDHSLNLVELTPFGGFWYSMASRLFYFNLQSLKYEGMYNREFVRTVRFYIFLPIMLIVSNGLIPIFIFFSLFDTPDEANNLFFIVEKPKR